MEVKETFEATLTDEIIFQNFFTKVDGGLPQTTVWWE